MTDLKYYWHLHHDILLESLTEPLKNRINFIKKEKPKNEIKLRLKLFRPFKGKLPVKTAKALEAYDKALEAYYKAREVYDKAREVYYKARESYYKAREAYYKAGEAYDKALEVYDKTLNSVTVKKLHKKECGCGWNGKTIFTKGNGLVK